jgi:hypothetical protein
VGQRLRPREHQDHRLDIGARMERGAQPGGNMSDRMRIGDIAFVKMVDIDPKEVMRWKQATNAWVVRSDQLAASIAPILEHNDVELVLVRDPDDAERVTGILSPEHVRAQVATHFGGKPGGTFASAIETLEANPKVSGEFGHEYLNYMRPMFHYCSKGGHIMNDPPPCPKHR